MLAFEKMMSFGFFIFPFLFSNNSKLYDHAFRLKELRWDDAQKWHKKVHEFHGSVHTLSLVMIATASGVIYRNGQWNDSFTWLLPSSLDLINIWDYSCVKRALTRLIYHKHTHTHTHTHMHFYRGNEWKYNISVVRLRSACELHRRMCRRKELIQPHRLSLVESFFLLF